MSQQHSGNVQPSIDREEHATAGGVDAKKVMVFDNAGNQIISFGGSGSGQATVTPKQAWPDPNTYIGLATVTPASNVTLNPSAAYIGLTTVVEAIPYSSPSIVHGMVSAASGALVQFAANAIKWVDVKASYGNATQVYVGGSLATINNGYPLMPGETIGMAISNTNQLYLVGVGTSECRFLAGN